MREISAVSKATEQDIRKHVPGAVGVLVFDDKGQITLMQVNGKQPKVFDEHALPLEIGSIQTPPTTVSVMHATHNNARCCWVLIGHQWTCVPC